MLEKILMWIAQSVVAWLAKKTQTEVTKLYKEVQDEKEFEKVNQTNVEKYNAAQDRLEKIKAAQDLLNRTRS